MSDIRAEFEAFISLPPHEKEISRFPDNGSSAWPGSYKNLIVDLAWDAWQASRKALSSCPEIPDSSEPDSRQALDGEAVGIVRHSTDPRSDNPSAYIDWQFGGDEINLPEGEKLYTHSASAQKEIERWKSVAHDQAATISELQCLVHESRRDQASLPKGWTIEPFDDGFGVEGISVLWPGDRGGAHLRANDPKNSIAQNLLYDLADALLYGSQPASCSEIPNSSDPESAVPEGFCSLAEATLAGCKCVLFGKGNRRWPCPIHASCKRPTLGQRKADQVGTTIGVLVQNQHGKVCAVTDMGRCTWLKQDVTGPGDEQVIVPDAEYTIALQDACDIIQADANTDRNYGSLCRIGSVLAKLKATPDNAEGDDNAR